MLEDEKCDEVLRPTAHPIHEVAASLLEIGVDRVGGEEFEAIGGDFAGELRRHRDAEEGGSRGWLAEDASNVGVVGIG